MDYQACWAMIHISIIAFHAKTAGLPALKVSSTPPFLIRPHPILLNQRNICAQLAGGRGLSLFLALFIPTHVLAALTGVNVLAQI